MPNRLNCGFSDTNQRAGPGIGKVLQVVSGDVQIAERLEGVHEEGGELGQPVVGQVEFLQLPQADPVSSCEGKRVTVESVSVSTKAANATASSKQAHTIFFFEQALQVIPGCNQLLKF